MDIWKKVQPSMLHRRKAGTLNIIICLFHIIVTRYTISAAASREIQTFDDGSYSEIPFFECGVSGWSIEQTNQGNRVIATCPNMCTYELTVIEGATFELGSGTVTFNYALNVQESSSITNPQSGPVLNVYCDTCSVHHVWSSQDKDYSRTDGVWVSAYVEIKPAGSFSLIFEASLGAIGQVVGVDDVIIQNDKLQKFPVPTIPLEYPLTCYTNKDPSGNDVSPLIPDPRPTHRGDDGDDGTSASIYTNSDQIATHGAVQTFNPDTMTTDSLDLEAANSFRLLDQETTLLLAQIMAIVSVSVCLVTVTIHCVIWGKQRKLQKVQSLVPLRHKPPAAEPHDSMLLEMDIVPTEEPDQPCSNSNSLCGPSKAALLEKLKESDILQQKDPRRATIGHDLPVANHAAMLEEDDTEEEHQRPHPRTKSLPGRPTVNVYESIDEIVKYQPLRFEKRPAPQQKPPAVPGARRLNERTRGVQNLAAVKKYRPISVQYEEVGSHKDILFEEPRDRSKSASNYDYVKRKAASQMPRRNVRKYGQTPRPKGRAPPPPAINRLYDKPLNKSRAVQVVSSAPTLLLPNQNSSRESIRTDNESIPEECDADFNRAGTSTFGTPTRPAVESAYFTLDPSTIEYASSSGESDDERESEKDVSRFEDAEETTFTHIMIPNGRGRAPRLDPVKVSAPIVIQPAMKSPRVDDYEEETSHL